MLDKNVDDLNIFRGKELGIEAHILPVLTEVDIEFILNKFSQLQNLDGKNRFKNFAGKIIIHIIAYRKLQW